MNIGWRHPFRSIALISSFGVLYASAISFDCKNVIDDRVKWNLQPLAGVHTVWHSYNIPPTTTNWTFSLDLCDSLPKNPDLDKSHQCPDGTRVCASKYLHTQDKKADTLEEWVAIAGNFDMNYGSSLEIKPTRLKNTGSREGLLLELMGGKHPLEKVHGIKQIKQKASIELLCNQDKTGWEPQSPPKLKRSNDDDDGEDDKAEENVGSALQFVSYEEETITNEVWGVLRLKWESKYGCEERDSSDSNPADPPSKKASGWGLFTWLILLCFLGLAGYIILGSWINYHQYGARGLDLLPHSDVIRDIPYITKDILRRIQGGGSRGGYSAV